MSYDDENKDLTSESVHGIKNTWQKFGTKKEIDADGKYIGHNRPDPEPEDEPAVLAEPKETEPVAEKPAPAPVKGEDWVSGVTLNNMADHLRRTKRLKITIEQAKELILNDKATKVTYQNHKN